MVALNLDDIAVILISMTALILLVSYEWRLSIGALGTMYVGVFILTALTWPIEMAVVKLVAGWISASVLGISLVNLRTQLQLPGRFQPSEIIFRVSAAGLAILVTISLTPSLRRWLPQASYEQILGGLLLIGMGLLHLGFTTHPLRTIVGILTFFAGFEILYVTLDSSVLVAGLIAVINLWVY